MITAAVGVILLGAREEHDGRIVCAVGTSELQVLAETTGEGMVTITRPGHGSSMEFLTLAEGHVATCEVEILRGSNSILVEQGGGVTPFPLEVEGILPMSCV